MNSQINELFPQVSFLSGRVIHDVFVRKFVDELWRLHEVDIFVFIIWLFLVK